MVKVSNIPDIERVSSTDGTMMWTATHYKPVSNGNRSDGLAQDFVNENIELVRKLSFSIQLSDPDDYEGGNVQLLDEPR